MTDDISRRDLLIGAAAVAGAAALPDVGLPEVNEIVACVEVPTTPVVALRWIAKLITEPDGRMWWTLSKPEDDQTEERSR